MQSLSKKILIITHSSEEGLNYGIAFFCKKTILLNKGHMGIDVDIINDPSNVTNLNEYDQIIMIVPEWNGSFPFSFKKLIDDSGYPSTLYGKEILLVGTSNNTFGNIIGVSHLRHPLEYVGADIFYKQVCIPNIKSQFEGNKTFYDRRLEDYVIIFSTSKKFINC